MMIFSQLINAFINSMHQGWYEQHPCMTYCSTTHKTIQVGRTHILKVNRRAASTQTTHSFSPFHFLFWTSLFVGARTQLTDPFPPQFELSSLNGTYGCSLNSNVGSDLSSSSVSSAGDVNGDGITDLLIGADWASPSGRTQAGITYVVYGSRTMCSGGNVDLSNLNGTRGFAIHGAASFDHSGFSVSSAGDVNGDGFSDLVIGAFNAKPFGIKGAGKSYLIFGSQSFIKAGILELTSLNGTNGFILNGESHNDWSGRIVSSAGDVNGDGLAEIVIGAPGEFNSGKAGKSYVVYGSRNVVNGGVLELSSLNGTNGYIINGEATGDQFGRSVSSAGDVNGDGVGDLVIGAYEANYFGMENTGKSYVIYGSRSIARKGVFELTSLNGTNGFIVNGEASNDGFGRSVSSAGDVNGDGIGDLVICAVSASISDKISAGKCYVIFGSRNIASGGLYKLDSLDGRNGFIINGEATGDHFGRTANIARDFNGDGISDLVIGAPGRYYEKKLGKCYVVYGSRSIVNGGVIELTSLNGTNGFFLKGEIGVIKNGNSASSAGDVNGDGIADIVIGANTIWRTVLAGKSYLIFGRNFTMRKQPPSSVLTMTSQTTKSTPRISSTSFSGPTNPYEDTPVSQLKVSTSAQLMPPSILILDSPTNSSTPLIVGITLAISALACSVISGAAIYFIKRSHSDPQDHGTEPSCSHPDPAVPAEYVAISSLQPEMQSVGVEGNYAILPSRNLNNHYKDWPKQPAPDSTELYDQINLDQLNKNMDQYKAAKLSE